MALAQRRDGIHQACVWNPNVYHSFLAWHHGIRLWPALRPQRHEESSGKRRKQNSRRENENDMEHVFGVGGSVRWADQQDFESANCCSDFMDPAAFGVS